MQYFLDRYRIESADDKYFSTAMKILIKNTYKNSLKAGIVDMSGQFKWR